MIFCSHKRKRPKFIDKYEVVDSYKYLGHVIHQSLHDESDVELRLNSFYASFNSVFRKFGNVNKNTLLFLFKSYCLPNYGLPLWNSSKIISNRFFKAFVIAFSDAMKKMSKVPRHTSSHNLAKDLHILLFNHYFIFVQW